MVDAVKVQLVFIGVGGVFFYKSQPFQIRIYECIRFSVVKMEGNEFLVDQQGFVLKRQGVFRREFSFYKISCRVKGAGLVNFKSIGGFSDIPFIIFKIVQCMVSQQVVQCGTQVAHIPFNDDCIERIQFCLLQKAGVFQ